MASEPRYAADIDELERGRVRRLTFRGPAARGDGELLTYAAVLRAWRADADFRDAFTAALAADSSPAFFFETPPVSADTTGRPFECVLASAPRLAAVAPDPRPFRAHLAGHGGVRTFANLGGDATLVAPCADADPRHYPHLAAFVRGAPRAQVHALWRAVGLAVEARLSRSGRPCWVSTSGLGVFWTHVRIDDRPKYYTHAPYRH